MNGTGFISLIIIIANVIISYRGFKDPVFFQRYLFDVDRILINKEYYRFITSGFLHVSWMHLIFNMVALFFFSGAVEAVAGDWGYLIIYFSSLIGGDLLSFLIHRNEGDYTAVGASGAVMGIIFASIALFPDMPIRLFILPAIPAWLYGLVYVLYSIYGIRSRRDNVGHDAHLGGALIGMGVALLMHPEVILGHYIVLLLITVPSIFFIYMIITRPGFLLVDNFFFNKHNRNFTIDQRYNIEKIDKQTEVDRILDKINRSGMKSLTLKEKQMLDEYSKISR